MPSADTNEACRVFLPASPSFQSLPTLPMIIYLDLDARNQAMIETGYRRARNRTWPGTCSSAHGTRQASKPAATPTDAGSLTGSCVDCSPWLVYFLSLPRIRYTRKPHDFPECDTGLSASRRPWRVRVGVLPLSQAGTVLLCDMCVR